MRKSTDMTQFGRIRAAFRVTAIVTITVIGVLLPIGVLAQEGWPKPPRGPEFAVPTEETVNTPIEKSTERAGSQVRIVRPSWPGPLPVIPPLPSSALLFTDGSWDVLPLTLIVEAGTFDQVVQVRVTPINTAEIAVAFGTALLAYHIEVFDAEGNEWLGTIRRPIRASVPGAVLVAAGYPAGQLVFTLIDHNTTVPQVTSFNENDASLSTRLITTGVLVLENWARP